MNLYFTKNWSCDWNSKIAKVCNKISKYIYNGYETNQWQDIGIIYLYRNITWYEITGRRLCRTEAINMKWGNYQCIMYRITDTELRRKAYIIYECLVQARSFDDIERNVASFIVTSFFSRFCLDISALDWLSCDSKSRIRDCRVRSWGKETIRLVGETMHRTIII